MPIAVYALTAGAFGIGTTEFVIMGLLLQVASDLQVSVAMTGLLISGYALGVFVGAPVLTLATRKLPRKQVLILLMAIFTLGNIACALAPSYGLLMAARIVTSLAHGTFFGVGSVVATSLVPEDKKASAIAVMFTGLTIATLLGVPAGAWLGLHFGWRATFWTIAVIGVIAMLVLARLVPADKGKVEVAPLRQEIATLADPQVLLGLTMTVLGFGGVFAVFTYIQPILVEITGFSQEAVSPILLLFGLGLIVGNMLGGKLADRNLPVALLATTATLAIVLFAMTATLRSPVAVTIFVGLIGAAAFATVAPLQMRVLDKAGPAGRNLASSLNIAAFNLGNAFGAWLGGVTIEHGPGLAAVTWVAALVPLASLVLAVISLRLDKRPQTALQTASCPQA
ncbi:Inner membrane transport protein YdhP [Bosea sp. 62]|uniref:MFS transporter n=1 Tax=unclassified Bosea (in: a-proteobacteria) TaxID=2653178 RepID=UPI0012590E54|nr:MULTISPECIES: MFS transporter [unclassified Bosea (in: a-proteobacteria)]CAD5259577.1 Inner membrane transport protein YdhP [Bosea sp. 46]CAD5264006.1 Inner membrane transport protein YdhP [Bosea sp. 21B]CAD5276283.1 Inner membrane transport protein YdhP [Bosea sp. 7B]VVT59059.1 Inner membrane transport protein YdhP [Bosea sp. EC-HK365B]VXB67420.1 Inner membrane transport protein YdhP [Bosea sp. 29B]